MTEQIKEFLRESNAIEGVFDEESLSQAMTAWNFLIKEHELCIYNVLKTHKILMLNQPNLRPDEKGYFRRVGVRVGGRDGLKWTLIPMQMANWVMNANDLIQNGQSEPPSFLEKVIKTQHIVYEQIHPFVDGNGRTGRMFMNYSRLKLGLPVLVVKDAEKQDYYSWFK